MCFKKYFLRRGLLKSLGGHQILFIPEALQPGAGE
jgi:hypothetical protein